MRYTQPNNKPTNTTAILKIDGCNDNNVEFTLLENAPVVGKRRYCNKILVHECIMLPEPSPLELDRVELIATSDPCYKYFEIYKTSEDAPDIPASILLEVNTDGLTESIVVQFSADDLCGLPGRLAFRLYGYQDDIRILLTGGVMYSGPCACCEEKTPWVEVTW